MPDHFRRHRDCSRRSLWQRVCGVVTAGLWQRRLSANARSERMADVSPLLVIAPHQDDETLGCGGLIALKRKYGAAVTVVFMTDGGGASSETGYAPDYVATRKREATNALSILGVDRTSIYFLDGPDGNLGGLSLERANPLVDRLAALIEAIKPAQIAVTFRNDIHPDHEASFSLCVRALERCNHTVDLWEYPLWSFWHPHPDNRHYALAQGLVKVDISEVCSIKRQAVNCFKSQLSKSFLGSPGCLPPLLVQRLTTAEELFFVEVWRPDAPDQVGA